MPQPPSPDLSPLPREVSPFALFSLWWKEALEKDPYPEVMTLATVRPPLGINVRSILLRKWDEKGFCFYSSRDSAKGKEMDNNSSAALLLYWKSLRKQIKILGDVEVLDRKHAEAYYLSRPYGSQVAGMLSAQSSPLDDYDKLAETFQDHVRRDVPIVVPDHWTAYRLKPTHMEFLQEHPDRLHQRVLYTLSNSKGNWERTWLYP